jgi:hypothetical protein
MKEMTDFHAIGGTQAMDGWPRGPTLDEMERCEGVSEDCRGKLFQGEDDRDQLTCGTAVGRCHFAGEDGCGVDTGVDGSGAADPRDDGAISEVGVFDWEGGVIRV